jgi:hypothetical protein
LKSLIVGGVTSLGAWLEKGDLTEGDEETEGDEDELESRLGKLDLHDFDELFVRTLDFLGRSGGTMVEENTTTGQDFPIW